MIDMPLPSSQGVTENTTYLRESKTLDTLYAPIQMELQDLEKRIEERLNTDVVIISQAAHYLMDAGGKRIRPAILLAFAQMLGAPREAAIELSAVIEFIHSATLLHDDVVDSAPLRRGLDSSNQRFGNAVSVLVGDFLYSRAFQMMVRVNRLEVMKILSEATNTIAEGEVLQLINIGNVDLTREEYYQTIYCKTARLFEAATELAVVLTQPIAEESNPSAEVALLRMQARDFGKHLGHAFQLADDALDYSANTENSGKEVAHDLQEGKITLPLLIALEQSPDASALKIAIREDAPNKTELVINAINAVQGLQQTLIAAREEIHRAMDCLKSFPQHPAKKMLTNICEFVLARTF